MKPPSFPLSHLLLARANGSSADRYQPVGISPWELEDLEQLVSTQRRIKRRDALFRCKDKFESLYFVRKGFLKSSVMSNENCEQVTGFHMAGDVVGFDGIASEAHACDMVTLEDTLVCVMPYDRLAKLAETVPVLRRYFQKLMSREMARDQGAMLLLGSMSAEQRVATFLLDLSQRFFIHGDSQTEFTLPMRRAEIGSFIGVRLETVSRYLQRFVRENLIEVNRRHITLTDLAGLRRVSSGREARERLAPAPRVGISDQR